MIKEVVLIAVLSAMLIGCSKEDEEFQPCFSDLGYNVNSQEAYDSLLTKVNRDLETFERMSELCSKERIEQYRKYVNDTIVHIDGSAVLHNVAYPLQPHVFHVNDDDVETDYDIWSYDGKLTAIKISSGEERVSLEGKNYFTYRNKYISASVKISSSGPVVDVKKNIKHENEEAIKEYVLREYNLYAEKYVHALDWN